MPLAQIFVHRTSGVAEDWEVALATVLVYIVLWGYPALLCLGVWLNRWRILAALFPKSTYKCKLCDQTTHKWQKTIWRRGHRLMLEDDLCRECWWTVRFALFLPGDVSLQSITPKGGFAKVNLGSPANFL